MNLRMLVQSEILQRPTSMLTGVLAVALSVAALVAIRHVTVFSEREVGRKLESLGANLLVLPKDSSLQDYYAADLTGKTLPESHVAEILMANLPGVERLSPRLCVATQVAGRDVTLTGILPQIEFKAKVAWQAMGLLNTKTTCCQKMQGPKAYDAAPEDLALARTIDRLKKDEAVIGADVAQAADLVAGQSIKVFDETLNVVAVLPRTGTIDDSRVFAHLHTVQRLNDAGEVVNAIEVMGCCQDAAGNLAPSLRELLPDAKVVTISQIVATQVGVNRLMSQMSLFVFGILIAIGGASVSGTIGANVRERRKEIGTLLALGATPRLIAAAFLLKALVLGLTGAIAGIVLGLVPAVVFGGRFAGVTITPQPGLIAAAFGAAVLTTLAAAVWPVRTAAKLDPCLCFQEV